MSSTRTPASRFSRETAVTPDASVPGRYRALLSEEWCAPDVPQGGLATVVALRAMAAALDAAGPDAAHGDATCSRRRSARARWRST